MISFYLRSGSVFLELIDRILKRGEKSRTHRCLCLVVLCPPFEPDAAAVNYSDVHTIGISGELNACKLKLVSLKQIESCLVQHKHLIVKDRSAAMALTVQLFADTHLQNSQLW